VVRTYSAELVEGLETKTVHDGLQYVLAKKCTKAKIPAIHVANLLDVSRMAVHIWFRGGEIKPSRVPYVEALIRIIDEDTAKGVLPLKGYKDAVKYYESLIDSGPK
jgi:hypothetical protein